MACGAPPVVTDLDANREWITDRENGLLVSPDDARSLAAAVTRTIEDREFTRSVIERNLRLIDERGGWKTNMGILEKAFEALID
jgi:glycosyltransferase involved in cell wall biosynthesis